MSCSKCTSCCASCCDCFANGYHSAENIISGMSKTIREFQDATMLGDHIDLPDTVTPSSLRQAVQDWGDTIDRLARENRQLNNKLESSMDQCEQLDRRLQNYATASVSTDKLPCVVMSLAEYDRVHEKIVILSQKVGALEGEHIALRAALAKAQGESR